MSSVARTSDGRRLSAGRLAVAPKRCCDSPPQGYDSACISVVIPALNEEQAIEKVLSDLPRDVVHEVIVVDNGSTDRSADVAREHGARVIRESRRGYGQACLTGMAALSDATQIVVFLDADYSDDPRQLPELVAPIAENRADLVIGSRVLGGAERGSLTPQQRAGNWLACQLIRWRWGFRYTDLGPFRAARRSTLETLQMRDRAFGWTVEMQLKALQQGVRVVEVPVRCRPRIGQSKISGTILGTIRAGTTILTTIARHAAS
jgi:cellulose synthase/poly-beta-1,6-N-acetylglucosamine synthase-like glycosyltransferase